MRKVALVSNGDMRQPLSQVCWPKQEEALRLTEESFQKLDVATFRANPYKKELGHGFINTQAEACQLFASLDPCIPIVIVLSSWVWAHHVAGCLKLHKGPILLIGDFDGTWPGLVSLLNHSATLERMNIEHSKVWTNSFVDDPNFMENLTVWVQTGKIDYSQDHVTSAHDLKIPDASAQLAREIGQTILRDKRILGQMDPGCMGMFNAVISPDKLASIGMPLELLSQSDLLAEMSQISDETANRNLEWLKQRGVTFHWGTVPHKELVDTQVLEQMKMYTAAGIIYHRYGLAAIGIPYQYGLVRCTSASDLPEGMLNNSDRPEIIWPETDHIINQDKPIVHFNEGDLGSAVPQVLMNEILSRKEMPLETTLHDVRWGDWWKEKFLWVFEISGGAPAEHFGGWSKVHVYRQPVGFFPRGGGSCSGVSKPGAVTWARFYESFGKIGMDCGTGQVIELPESEVHRRLSATTKEWPIANVYIPGYGRDELMSSHRSNHITICYGNILAELVAVCGVIGLDSNVVGDAREDFR